MEFEDVLLEVGDYGKYQKKLIWLFLVPAASLLPWFTMNVLFMVSVPEHWCNVPEVTTSNLSVQDQRALISPPGEKCHMYNINFTNFLSNGSYEVPNDTTTRPCDKGWQYDQTYWDSTAATMWNMVCEDGHYTSFVLTLYNVGSIIGTPIYGALSDKIGRKITFFISIVVTATTAISSVLVTDFTAFVVIKTINGSLMPTVFQLPFIIILEIVAPEIRTKMNGIVNCSWTVGLSLLPLIAYLSRSWVTLGLVTSSVTVIFIGYWTFLPESPRWLVSQERYEEAAKIMVNIAKKNGKTAEETSITQKLQKLGEKMKKEKDVDGVQNSSADLIRYPQLRKKFLIITACWMADIMAYYGLQLNVSNLAGNEFINFLLLSLVEIPGYLTSWVVMEKYGRRWCSVAGFLLTGITCMMSSIDLPYMDVICSMLGKYCISATFMATYQQSSELYPTVVRSLGMGMSSTISMIATLIVPYLVYLSVYGKAIPFVIIGLSCIVAGVLASFLPETLNENLPQTIFDAEAFGRNQKFFSCNRRRRSVSRERAASFGLKIKGFDAICGLDEKDPKRKRSSQILQNIEMAPGVEQTLKVSDSLKTSNGPLKRDSLDNRKNSNLSSFVPNDTSHETSVPESKDAKHQESSAGNENEVPNQNEAGRESKNDKLQESSAGREQRVSSQSEEKIPKTKEEDFSYDNKVFETNDKEAKWRDAEEKNTDRQNFMNNSEVNRSKTEET